MYVSGGMRPLRKDSSQTEPSTTNRIHENQVKKQGEICAELLGLRAGSRHYVRCLFDE